MIVGGFACGNSVEVAEMTDNSVVVVAAASVPRAVFGSAVVVGMPKVPSRSQAVEASHLAGAMDAALAEAKVPP